MLRSRLETLAVKGTWACDRHIILAGPASISAQRLTSEKKTVLSSRTDAFRPGRIACVMWSTRRSACFLQACLNYLRHIISWAT